MRAGVKNKIGVLKPEMALGPNNKEYKNRVLLKGPVPTEIQMSDKGQ